MESYGTEEEQVEALKRWWSENGRSMVVSVVVAVCLGLGWSAWKDNREASLAQASYTYQQMLTQLTEGTPAALEQARANANQLLEAHRGSAYAQFAALHLARLYVTDGEVAAAEEQLRWVAGEADGELQAVAQLRLARVLADRGELEQALTMLAAGQGGDLASSYAMARGDVLMAAGREDEALLAYDAAAAALDPTQPLPASLQEKMSYLNPLPASGSTPTETPSADGAGENAAAPGEPEAS